MGKIKTIKGATYEEIIQIAKKAMKEERDVYKKRYGEIAFKTFNRNEKMFAYLCENYTRHPDEWEDRYEAHLLKGENENAEKEAAVLENDFGNVIAETDFPNQ